MENWYAVTSSMPSRKCRGFAGIVTTIRLQIQRSSYSSATPGTTSIEEFSDGLVLGLANVTYSEFIGWDFEVSCSLYSFFYDPK